MDWAQLLDSHGAALTLYARQWTGSHADAEEIVQEAILRVWRRFDGRELDEEDLLPLVYASVKRAAVDRWRSDTRRRRREDSAGELLYDEDGQDELPLEKQERQASLAAAVRQLPPDQREVVTMHIWGNMPFRLIGEALGIPLNTAASRYRYALETIKRTLATEAVHD